MMSDDGKVSMVTFITGTIFALLPEILSNLKFDDYDLFENVWLAHAFIYLFLNLLTIVIFRNNFTCQVALRATFLGYVFGIGLLVYFTGPSSWNIFGMYMSIMATFHYSEFLTIAWTNPMALSLDAFMLNHSIQYGIAALISWLEFMTERYFFPEMKKPCFVFYLGFLLCIGGEILRKSAMFTARQNFNHVIQSTKADGHQLVTYGVYSLTRHPSYVGWFYWSIGTQVVLQNPVCTLCYAVVTWRFFYHRVLLEEMTLLNFFGTEYVDYQKRVSTGLPFISGYKIDL